MRSAPARVWGACGAEEGRLSQLRPSLGQLLRPGLRNIAVPASPTRAALPVWVPVPVSPPPTDPHPTGVQGHPDPR